MFNPYSSGDPSVNVPGRHICMVRVGRYERKNGVGRKNEKGL